MRADASIWRASARTGGLRANTPPQRRCVRSRRGGVTLLEVLVAMGLAAALLGAVIVFVGDLGHARERIEVRSARDRAIDSYLDAIEVAVASCVLDAGDDGFQGDSTTCTIPAATIDPSAALSSEGRVFVPAIISWFGFDEGDGSLLVRRGAGETEALAAEAARMRFRYHDGRAWVDAFDGRERGRLPSAIEVSIWAPLAARRTSPPAPATNQTDAPPTMESGPFQGDAMDQSPGPPDRRRVIVIPDASPAELLPAAPRSTP